MRLMTCYPPYAQLLALELKVWETRPRLPSYEGPIAIHAGKSAQYLKRIASGRLHAPADDHEFWAFIEQYDAALNLARTRGATAWQIAGMQLGVIVGVGELVESRPVEWIHDLSPRERAFGEFTPGRFGWRIMNVRHLRTPIPATGYQSLWKMPPEMIEQVLSEAV